MTASLPRSPESSSGISDQDGEVVSPENTDTNLETNDQGGNLDGPMSVDVDSSQPSSTTLRNESPLKRNEAERMQKETTGSCVKDFEVIDLAASSDEDKSKTAKLANSSVANNTDKSDASADQNQSGDAVATGSVRQDEPLNIVFDGGRSHQNDPVETDITTVLGITTAEPSQKPSEPEQSKQRPLPDKDSSPLERKADAACVVATQTDKVEATSAMASKAEIVGATFGTAAGTEEAEASSDAAAKTDIIMAAPDTTTETEDVKAAPETATKSNEAEAPSNMDVDTEKVVDISDTHVEIEKVVPSTVPSEQLTTAPSQSTPPTLSETSGPVKRSVSLLSSEQPPPKKSKGEGSSQSKSAVGEKVISETVASAVPSVPGTLLPVDQPPNASEVKSTSAMSENRALAATVSSPSNANSTHPICDPFFASRVDLSPIPNVASLPLLSPRDIAELEGALQIGAKYNHSEDNGWRDDWSGNLQLIDKELLMNRGQIAQDPQTKPLLLPFVEWAAKTAKDPNSFRGVHLLFSYVYHMKGTPPMAKKIMAYSLQRPAKTVDERLKHIVDGMRRISYDPTVLNQDGWTTAKAESPDGASGGAFLIGRRVIWHRYEAIVIAFVRDDEIGDLWKALWLEDHDTFDLEADELQDALKKWERKEQLKQKKLANRQTLLGGTVKPEGFPGRTRVPPASQRFAASSSFTVDGIEHGIILATSFNQQARQGVPWPARVMHVSEIKALGVQQTSRRSSSKNIIHVVFLAPYWNGQYAFSSKKPEPFNSKAATAKDPFSTGNLFEMDMIEVSESTIKKYPFDADLNSPLSIDKLRQNFRFLGLPKAAFPRYLDAHRLAMAFKSYAQREMLKNPSSNDQAQAGAFAALTDTHTLSVRAHLFPQASLDLPFEFILSNLPCPVQQATQLVDDGEETTEPVMNLHAMLRAMCPPRCWGVEPTESGKTDGNTQESKGSSANMSTPHSDRGLTPVKSPNPKFGSPADSGGQKNCDDDIWSLHNFASEYLLDLIGTGSGNEKNAPKLPYLGKKFAELVAALHQETETVQRLESPKQRKKVLGAFLKQCLVVKGHGEDIIFSGSVPKELNIRNIVLEWRKACERVYKRATTKCSSPGYGDGVTSVITDSRCNQHITASGSFERAVRLPAAIRGAKRAGAGSKESIALLYTVHNYYYDLAEDKILPKAHKASYLKRMKTKIASLAADAKGMPLTDDSDGEGGEDTMGSRGSYTAAVIGVAAALQGVDMIVGGQCVNVFCAIRPPGHHAGRELRPMNAISNGFCLLNAAACAALYATAPQSEGGLGLKRVCVIDFDVHHGNGTQDILCSTHDSRFLYVSTHAGGAHINGYENEGGTHDGFQHKVGVGKHDGIFPGRCGDTSPHEGVLNIPLGQKVTAAAVGNALVTRVAPTVEAFSPELIILSAGFDAHKNDPLGMGALTAEDFGSVTEVACQMAFKSCSGRVLSVLEGGYGVPCCRPPPNDLFFPEKFNNSDDAKKLATPVRLLDLGKDLPDGMEDPVTPHLQQKLERCHQEGFMHCIQEHVGSLAKCNSRGK